ncbi:BRO1 domain-containing protein BROX [Octopus sinensis]|uniref:BRO1 domain-containing protein BROX n=1 Tax=Octopus sinensis TaxID=2607531 RepID=A0A6P7SZ26_9MOLL|nr:BRO1 domain-containing protein BROX [Octopus sinensis]
MSPLLVYCFCFTVNMAAYWFHRNPLKATAAVTFELHGSTTDQISRKIISDLRMTRNNLLDLLTDPGHDKTIIIKAYTEYFAFLQGLYQNYEGQSENKLQKAIYFKWTNTLKGKIPVVQKDAIFEHASMVVNVALWFTKHAAKLAARDNVDMDEAKEVHRCLRIAAGMFTYVKNDLCARLVDIDSGTDLDVRVLDAFIYQSTAEAQEVTTARAIELKHSASLIAALTYETAQLYTKADDTLSSLDAETVNKWRKYFQLKKDFYTAYAHTYHGETLLAQDKCGEAIKCLQEAMKYFERSSARCKEYSAAKGSGTQAKPHEHIFFRNLGPKVRRTLEKCERENGMIYHQKIPYDAPVIELKATYGLVTPEEFQPIPVNPIWTPAVYQKFVVPDTGVLENKKQEATKQEELPKVQEKEYPMSDKNAKNETGCLIS